MRKECQKEAIDYLTLVLNSDYLIKEKIALIESKLAIMQT